MDICIVTGSSGLIGSESAKFFSSKNFKIIGIDNNLRKFFFGKNGDTSWVKKKMTRELKNYSHFNYDITDKKNISKVFNKYSSDIKLIIHCAAQPSHDWAYKDPMLDFKTNAEGTLNLLENFKKYCPKAVFINLSTNKVYGDNPNKLKILEKLKRWELNKNDSYFKGINEKFSIDNCTHSFFGVSKTYADLIVQEYGKNIGLKTVSFRGGCITGPNHNGAKLHGFLSYLVKSTLSKREYSLIGYKGKQVRDNLHSHDLVNCFWEFFKKPKFGEVYNIGGGRFSNCSILEAIAEVEDYKNIEINKKIIETNRVGDHIWYISDTRKFKKDYPKWKQKYNTKKIIRELIENN